MGGTGSVSDTRIPRQLLEFRHCSPRGAERIDEASGSVRTPSTTYCSTSLCGPVTSPWERKSPGRCFEPPPSGVEQGRTRRIRKTSVPRLVPCRAPHVRGTVCHDRNDPFVLPPGKGRCRTTARWAQQIGSQLAESTVSSTGSVTVVRGGSRERGFHLAMSRSRRRLHVPHGTPTAAAADLPATVTTHTTHTPPDNRVNGYPRKRAKVRERPHPASTGLVGPRPSCRQYGPCAGDGRSRKVG